MRMNMSKVVGLMLLTLLGVQQSVLAEREPSQLRWESNVERAMPGEEVTIAVFSDPGTNLKIEAQGIGLSQAPALADKKADSSGKASWTFKVNDNYKADKLPIIVTAQGDRAEKKIVHAINIEHK